MAGKPERMDVAPTEVWATPGKPIAVGHLGTILVGRTNARGEILIAFTPSRRIAKKLARRGKPRIFDLGDDKL